MAGTLKQSPLHDRHEALGAAMASGPGAADFVNATLSNDLAKIRPGKAQYTLCLDESGGIVDDLIAYWHDDEHVLLIPNAANTAERGYELVVANDVAGQLWDELMAAGEEHGITACGLGARDTLRTEMGYPLHGQDISLDTNPVEAGLSWAVGWKKDAFWGRDAVARVKEEGPKRRLRG